MKMGRAHPLVIGWTLMVMGTIFATQIISSSAADQSLNGTGHKERNSRPSRNKIHNSTSASSYYSYPFSKFALPECAAQQVCNAIYKRLNRIHSLCACPDKYENSCSISFNSNDEHTIELLTDTTREALTLVKTCESIAVIRACHGQQDWSILALQNIRTGKSHYLVTCRCLNGGVLEGPVAHENPPYAKIPGVRVYGMICNQRIRRRYSKDTNKNHSHAIQHNVDQTSTLSIIRRSARNLNWR